MKIMINTIFFPKFQKFVSSYLGMLLGAILLLLACMHRLQLDKPSYTHSPLIGIEISIMMLLLLVTFLYHPGNALILAKNKRWRESLIMILSALVGFGLLIAAANVDAPTLIYMT